MTPFLKNILKLLTEFLQAQENSSLLHLLHL